MDKKRKAANEYDIQISNSRTSAGSQTMYVGAPLVFHLRSQGDDRFYAYYNLLFEHTQKWFMSRSMWWLLVHRSCRVAYRDKGHPTAQDISVGMRLAMDKL